jgi:hypothetical protein
MVPKTFNGDEQLLYILNEMIVDVNNQLENGFDMTKAIGCHVWDDTLNC